MNYLNKTQELDSKSLRSIYGGVTEGGCILLPFPFPGGGTGPYNPIPEDLSF